jgi:hypothetical protein
MAASTPQPTPLGPPDALLYHQPFATGNRSTALSIGLWVVLAPLCYLGCARWYHRRAERSRSVALTAILYEDWRRR